jgi:outer membrane protein insertion porin family
LPPDQNWRRFFTPNPEQLTDFELVNMQRFFTKRIFQNILAFRKTCPQRTSFVLKAGLLLIVATASLSSLHAQIDTTHPTSVDPRLLEYENARVPKEYTIAGVEIVGIKHLDTAIVLSIAGLQVGDKYMHPGEDIFGKSIAALWRQKLFSDIEMYVSKIEGDKVWIQINVL